MKNKETIFIFVFFCFIFLAPNVTQAQYDYEKSPANAPCMRATALMAQGDLEYAETEFRRAIELDPYYDLAFSGLGVMYLTLHKVDEGIEIFEQGLKKNPTNANLYFHLGAAFTLKKDYKAAIDAVEHAVLWDDNFALAHYALGQLYQRQGRIHEAKEEYKMVIELLAKKFPMHPEETSAYAEATVLLKSLSAGYLGFLWLYYPYFLIVGLVLYFVGRNIQVTPIMTVGGILSVIGLLFLIMTLVNGCFQTLPK